MRLCHWEACVNFNRILKRFIKNTKETRDLRVMTNKKTLFGINLYFQEIFLRFQKTALELF